MLSSFDAPRSGRSSSSLASIIILRIGAGLTLLYLHAWSQAVSAWQHLWNGSGWDAVKSLQDAGYPLPEILAPLAAAITVLTAVSWILGFVTRFSSAIFIPVALMALVAANRAGQTAEAESCLLYFFIAATLVFTGSGWLALDTLFGMRKKKKSRW